MKADKTPEQSVISTDPFTGSKKVYVEGKIHPIKVAMREIELTDTVDKFNGKTEKNAPVTVYDCSGPYTDPNIVIDVKKGLPKLRQQWILDRGDVEELPGISSDYGKERLADGSLDHLRFEHLGNPLRAKQGANVSQLHYAKKGIITPEMEYIAIRENQRIDEFNTGRGMWSQHAGNSFGANTPKNFITPEFVRDEIAAGRAPHPSGARSSPRHNRRRHVTATTACSWQPPRSPVRACCRRRAARRATSETEGETVSDGLR